MRQPRYWGRSPRAATEPAQRGGGPAHFFSLTSATVGQLLFIFTLGFYGFLSFGFRSLENHHPIPITLGAVHALSSVSDALDFSCHSLHSLWKPRFVLMAKRREQYRVEFKC